MALAPRDILCVHVRTWVFSPDLPRESADIVRSALRCAEHVLRERDASGGASGGASVGANTTRLYLATDNAVAREAFRARLGERRVLTIPEPPSHIAYKAGKSVREIKAALES